MQIYTHYTELHLFHSLHQLIPYLYNRYYVPEQKIHQQNKYGNPQPQNYKLLQVIREFHAELFQQQHIHR